MKKTLAILLAASAASTVSAQVRSVGPFAGDLTESFEGRTRSYSTCVRNGVFGGIGDLCATTSLLAMASSWACQAAAPDGDRFYISTFTEAEYTFLEPVRRFGGHFGGGHTGNPDATVEFFDASGVMIGTDDATFPLDCTWHWHGWSFDVPVSRIVVRGKVSSSFGGLVAMDDMRIAFSPAGCRADCDKSTGEGVLDLNDLACFQAAFLAGDPYACDMDTSTGPGVCEVLDYMTFMDEYLGQCGM